MTSLTRLKNSQKQTNNQQFFGVAAGNRNCRQRRRRVARRLSTTHIHIHIPTQRMLYASVQKALKLVRVWVGRGMSKFLLSSSWSAIATKQTQQTNASADFFLVAEVNEIHDEGAMNNNAVLRAWCSMSAVVLWQGCQPRIESKRNALN